MVELLYFCFNFIKYQKHEHLECAAEMLGGLEITGKWSSEEEHETHFLLHPVAIPNCLVIGNKAGEGRFKQKSLIIFKESWHFLHRNPMPTHYNV